MPVPAPTHGAEESRGERRRGDDGDVPRAQLGRREAHQERGDVDDDLLAYVIGCSPEGSSSSTSILSRPLAWSAATPAVLLLHAIVSK